MNKYRLIAFAVLLSSFTLAMTFAKTAGGGSLTDNPSGGPALQKYNSTHVELQAGMTGNFYIVNAIDAIGKSTVPVFIKSSQFGNTQITGSVSGSTISFEWTAPSGGCNTTIVSYITSGNNANNALITSGGTATAGIAIVDANGRIIAKCGGTTNCPTSVTTTGGTLSCDVPVIQLSVSIVGADSATAANSSYSWSGPGVVAGGNTATPSVNVAGTYFVTVAVPNCLSSLSGSAVVDPNSNPCFSPLFCTVSDPQAVCEGGSVTMTAVPNDGLAPFTYSWVRQSDPLTVIGTEASLILDPAHLSDQGKYVVTIFDAASENSTCITTLTVDPLPNFTLVPNDTTITCAGSTDPASTGVATSADAVSYADTTSGSCPVVIKRTWTATNGCGSASHVQTITWEKTSISGVAYYDANENGVRDSGEPSIPNWKIVLSGAASAASSTDGTGAYAFACLLRGADTVSEVIPPAAGVYAYKNTTPASQGIDLVCPAIVDFGNVCIGTPGGYSTNYWHSAGCKYITHADVLALDAFCLADAGGSAYNPNQVSGCNKAFSDYLTNSVSSANMATMLSGQLIAAYLNVQHGMTVSTVLIDGSRDVNAEITYANLLLCANPLTLSGNPARAEQSRVRDILDKLNSGGGFAQATACGFTYPSTSSKVMVSTVAHKEIPDPTLSETVTPTAYALLGNYPNPFNPTTNIAYDLPEGGQVSLRVYDVLGREVALLVNGIQSAGRYTVQFDGSSLSNGVYFYRLQAGSFIATKSLVLMK